MNVRNKHIVDTGREILKNEEWNKIVAVCNNATTTAHLSAGNAVTAGYFSQEMGKQVDILSKSIKNASKQSELLNERMLKLNRRLNLATWVIAVGTLLLVGVTIWAKLAS